MKKTCKNCIVTFEANHGKALFCTPKCRVYYSRKFGTKAVQMESDSQSDLDKNLDILSKSESVAEATQEKRQTFSESDSGFYIPKENGETEPPPTVYYIPKDTLPALEKTLNTAKAITETIFRDLAVFGESRVKVDELAKELGLKKGSEVPPPEPKPAATPDWVSEIAAYCNEQGITPKDLIEAHKTPKKTAKEKKSEDKGNNQSGGSFYDRRRNKLGF